MPNDFEINFKGKTIQIDRVELHIKNFNNSASYGVLKTTIRICLRDGIDKFK